MNVELLQRFRDRLEAGEAVIGPFMKTLDPAFVEVAGRAGLDFVILDMEHGPPGFERLGDLIRAAELAGTVPIVRTADAGESAIGHALDLGAHGVQVPQVSTAEAARTVVERAKFHPAGARGVCRFVRAAGYTSVERGRYFEEANQTLVIVHLEGREALENLDLILEVDGLDVLFIGPYDLSQSLGRPGEVEHPDVVALMRDCVERAHARGRRVGTFTDTPEQARMWKQAGVQYVSYSVDVGIFYEACRAIRGLV